MAKIEKRVNLVGSERALLPGSRKIGPADPGERIQVTVFLRRGSSPKQSAAANKIGKLAPTQRRYVPFLLKLPHQPARDLDNSFNGLRIHDLLLELLSGRLITTEP